MPARSISRRRDSGVSSRSRPASTAADTARTTNSAPSRSGASSIAACASAWAAIRSPRRTADERAQRRDRRDRQRRAALARLREDLVRRRAAPRRAVGRREHGQRHDRPVLAAVGLEREARRERALREVDRLGRRAQVHHLVHRQRGERRRLQHAACRAARVSQRGDRRVRLAPGRRRGVADAQQRDLELLACRPPGRQPLLGAAQDRRSFSGAAGEEQHAAELDRRRGDRVFVLAVLDDLRQRGDRLRCAGAGVRLAELEHDARRARHRRGGSSSARASSAAAPAASPSASASRAASRSRATASGSAAGSVCMTCAATWPAGAPRSLAGSSPPRSAAARARRATGRRRSPRAGSGG